MLRVIKSLAKHSKRQGEIERDKCIDFLRDRYFIMVREPKRLLNFNIFWCK